LVSPKIMWKQLEMINYETCLFFTSLFLGGQFVLALRPIYIYLVNYVIYEQRLMTPVDKFDRQALFAVIDGHGGHAAADYVAENLGRNIVKAIECVGEEDRLEQAIRRGYLVTDKEFLSQVIKHCINKLRIDLHEHFKPYALAS
jgi:hypothetical protein